MPLADRVVGVRPTASESGAEADGGRGVGGLHTSDDDGERETGGPVRAKAARVGMNIRREIWATQRRRKPCHRDC